MAINVSTAKFNFFVTYYKIRRVRIVKLSIFFKKKRREHGSKWDNVSFFNIFYVENKNDNIPSQ